MNHDNIEPWLAMAIALSLWLAYFAHRCHDEWNRLDDYYAHVARHGVLAECGEDCPLDDQVRNAQRDGSANRPDESGEQERADVGTSGIHVRSVADTHWSTMDEVHAERLGRRG